ncbi:MAG: hypothetical protein WCK77_02360 [Verrucomicrobiota bacterium]
MNTPESTSAMIQRRDILRGCLRCGGLLALGGVAASLGWHSLHGECQRTNPCGGCPLFDGCGLPKARDVKSQASPDPKPGPAQPAVRHV